MALGLGAFTGLAAGALLAGCNEPLSAAWWLGVVVGSVLYLRLSAAALRAIRPGLDSVWRLDEVDVVLESMGKVARPKFDGRVRAAS